MAQCGLVDEETVANVHLLAVSKNTKQLKGMPEHLQKLYDDSTEFLVAAEA